jgi:hypothetical protein
VLFKTAEMEEKADQFGDTGQVSPDPGHSDETQLVNPEDKEQTEATEIRVVIVLKQMLCVSDRREKWQKDLQDIPN